MTTPASKQTKNDSGSPESGEPLFLSVGRLRKPHGLNGELLMDILTDFPERLHPKKQVYLGSKHQIMVIDRIRPHQNCLLIAFEGFSSIDAVEQFRNEFIYIRVDTLPQLPEGEYYHHQLLGLEVVKEDTQESIGILVEILQTGANDVYIVSGPAGQEILLPAVEGVIQKVDLEGKRMLVCPPEWL